MRTIPLAAILLLALTACAPKQGDPGATGRSSLLRTTVEAPGAQCASGGTRVELGTDDDGDQSLEAAEVDSTVYVCDGADGLPVAVAPEAAGPNCPEGGVRVTPAGGTPTYICTGDTGVTGPTGQDGASVTMTPEAPGTNCLLGGVKLQVGSGASTYLCDGATGPAGQDGASVTMTPEPPGANCGLGGVKLQVGSGPVSYLCNGAPAGTALPTVVTVGVSDVRYTAATVDADVSDDGGELIFARGVVLATHPSPTIHDTVFYSSPGAGPFATRCDLLAPDTVYWVRPFATNALGTSYGALLTFTTRALTAPVLSTLAVSNITDSTATSGGEITDDGGTPILSRGACWSAAPDPTTGSACVSEGVGAGSYLVLLTGLPSGTPLHVRAFASNAQGTSYGEDRPFTTVLLPLATVTTSAPTAVSHTSASGGGTVVSDHGAPVTARGICWATTPAPIRGGTCFTEAGGLGAFTASMTGLAAGTTFYVRAWALNGGGTSYGNEVSFTTLATSAPALTTRAVIGISSTLAGSGGVISSDGGSPITAKGVCWSINTNPTIANTRTSDGTGTAAFSSTLTGLNPLTTYYVRAYATNALGTAYGSELSFTTTDLVTPGPTLPVVGTSTSVITGSTTASSGGYVSNDGGSAISDRGVCWSTAQNPTLADSCASGGAGIGYFSATVTGLGGCGVVYYVRAYATNATGTAYGNQNSVSTGLLPTVTTAAVGDITTTAATTGGAVTSDGGCPITAKGVAYALTTSPAITGTRTTDGAGADPWISSLAGLFYNRTYFVRAYATNQIGTTYGAEQVFTTLEPPAPYIGQSWAGGVIFYIDGTGAHGLAVTPSDYGGAPWGCYGTSISTSAAFGDGPSNTAAIVASCAQAGIAARVADDLVLNGYSDWFMPSKDEVTAMFTNLGAVGYPGLTAAAYLSSTELDANSAMTNGGAVGKSTTASCRFGSCSYFNLRPVRAF